MSKTVCPHCHRPIQLTPISTPAPARSGSRSRTLSQTTPTLSGLDLAEIGTDWQRVTPVARLEPRDITTAVYDAGVSFCLVSIAAGGMCWYFGWPGLAAPGAGLATALWRYFDGLALAKGLLEIVESATSRTDKAEPEPEPEPLPKHRVSVEISDPDNNRWAFADLDIEPARLHALASAIIAGEPFAERTATGLSITQAEFGDLRDTLIDRGLAMWRHPTRRQQGVELTVGGRRLMRAILATPLPPSGDTATNSAYGQHAAARSMTAGNYAFTPGQR